MAESRGEASAADLVRMRSEAANDPSLMDHSSAMDRSNTPLDSYVTIGSVTAPGLAQSSHAGSSFFTRVPVSIGASVPSAPTAAYSATSREANAMRAERAALAAATAAEPPSSQGSDVYSQPPGQDSHLVSLNRGQGFDSADDGDGSYLEPTGSGFSAAGMSTYSNPGGGRYFWHPSQALPPPPPTVQQSPTSRSMALESNSAFTIVPSVGGRSGGHGGYIANSDGLSAMMAAASGAGARPSTSGSPKMDPASELSALINRAKHLMGAIDSQRLGSDGQRTLHTHPLDPLTPASAAAYPSTMGAALEPVEERPADEEQLLNSKLADARGSLAAAYAALNDNYERSRALGAPPPEAAVSASNPLLAAPAAGAAAGSGSDSATRAKLKLASADSSSTPTEKVGTGVVVNGGMLDYMPPTEGLTMIQAAQKVAAFHVQQSHLLTIAEYNEAVRKETKARRKIKIKIVPMILYFAFVLCAGFYFYTRIIYGMGGLTHGLQSYSFFVLFVEMLGAINMLFYACWLFARPVNTDVFPPPMENGELPPLRRKYIVRVLIPCYKESLAIIQRTVLATRRADRPAGMRVIIYVCDDGADDAKAQWVSSLLDRDVVYITGRDKTEKSKNGKSANLNNTLQLIYPDIKDPINPDEFMKIPINELMCLFDADQTCSKAFFTTLMRYIDSGDDVGVALSPQLMFNVVPDCDIFNHQNVHFWEMMQPGMDALGFISLTGTNMILRSRALCEAGWFPMNTVTEDWALGMRFKKLGWRCRYVDKYLVIGEAPDVTKQAFQQRSRWCKGHFQVFYSEECPIFDRRLNLFQRLAYSSTCASYLSTGLSVVTLNLVPVLTILFGWFPIALNATTVIGITAYYLALNALSFYCLSWSHFKALWLANMSSVILFWPYLKASFMTPVKQLLGRTMEFKTTLKGSNARDFSFKVYGMPLIIISINLASFLIGVITLDTQINAAKSISLCWIVFNTVPHMLLLLNSYFGPGVIMSIICKGCMALTTAAGALAIVLMWLLYPREVNWEPALDASIKFMQAQMSGKLPGDHVLRVPWRFNTGLQYRDILISSRSIRSTFRPYENPNMAAFNATLDLSEGFYEDGPWGPIKITKNNGFSTAMLGWAMLDAEESFRENRDIQEQSLNVLQHGLDYLKACYIPDPSGYGSQYGDVYVYQVGDVMQERRRWRRPEDIKVAEPVYVTAGIEQPTDLTAHMTAGIVASTLALHRYGRLSRVEALSNIEGVKGLYNVTVETAGVLKHYRSLWRSDSFYDDKLWAATWMYRAAKASYDDPLNVEKYFADMQDAYYNAIGEEDTFIVDLDYVLNAGIVHASLNTFSYEFQTPAQTFVWDWICSGHPEYTNLGRARAQDSPYLGDTVLAAALAQIYVIKLRYFDKLKSGYKRGFQCFAQQQARYLIGTDWNRKSYVVGLGKKGYDHTVHRGASCPAADPEQPLVPCPPDTRGSNRPDENEITGGILWLPEATDDPKNTRGGNNTAVSLGNNAGLPLLMAGLQMSTITWLQCLQNSGAFLPHPVCKTKRPIPIARMGRSERKRYWGYDFGLEELEEEGLEQAPEGVDILPLTRDIGTPPPAFVLDPEEFDFDLEPLVGKAWLFYEVQRSGKLPDDNRIRWRGDSYERDGSEHVPPVDLSGGWYDAGDTLKLTMPLCASVWRLAWAMMSYRDILQETSWQTDSNWMNGIRQLRWIATWLRKARIKNPNNTQEFVIQIGDFDTDHTVLPGRHIAPEYWNKRNISRPVFTLGPLANGSDLAGEAVAAYASLSILFRDVDPQLSVALEEDAFSMYAFMERMPNTRYSDNNVQFQIAYASNTPRGHEFLAAAWMFRMTNDPKYVATAQAVHAQAGALFHNPVIGWSNPLQEARLVLEEVGEGAMLQSVQLWLNDHMSGKDAKYTQKGLWHEAEWGSLRNAAFMAHVALRAAKIMDDRAFDSGEVVNVAWAHHARCFARQQMNYIYGDTGHSFITDWGVRPPKRPHHRGALCGYVLKGEWCDAQQWNDGNRTFANTVPGAVVGGPNLYDEWTDDHRNYVTSEVAVDYNAALLSGTLGMMQLPRYFWRTTEHCPKHGFPVRVDFETAVYRPIPGVKLTREHPSVIV